jgi:acylphosphatase
VCQQFKITGRVQGVFFRDSTREVAATLDLKGHATNLADGSVEVVACGTDAAIDVLEDWLQTGPRRATVASVNRKEMRCERPGGFTIG